MTSYDNKTREIVGELKKVLVGKNDIIVKVFLTVIAGGHILLEDIPGVGKTTLALALSKVLALDYGRIQFTPDVLPSDIVGFSIYNKESRAMEYVKGAVICNLFLADELNRATSRTQSALLEAMEEQKVTVDGISHILPDPFLVIATQNPKGAAGTQLLPDSQMDRFMIKLSIGYPDLASEKEMLKSRKNGVNPLDSARQVVTREELSEMKREAAGVYIDDAIYDYIVRLVAATRRDNYIYRGASPRASLALASMAKATAWVLGRDYTVPEDVSAVFGDCIAHRLLLNPEAEATGKGAKWVTDKILAGTARPGIK